ncbi:MAG: DUF3866 family protein [Actinobacteria bacterium]|nr:DUF3866 family protein [Actinomycetota bacterium]
MPNYRTGRVVEVLASRPGLQKVTVEIDGTAQRSYVLTGLVGTVAPGQRVVVNTTAVDLGLGTGGWHFVHWNLDRDAYAQAGPGHIMKLRYTSLQADTGCVEEHDDGLSEATTLGGMPVVHCALHSQLAAAAAAFKERAPAARLAYVMTDGAALPLALSDLVADLVARRLLDVTVTAGHAFGGDLEAINVHSALAIAHHHAAADAVVAAVGPGIVGTNTALGHTGLEAATVLDAAAALEGRPIAALRVSFADPRERHQGVSHHSRTALGVVARSRFCVPVPALGGEEEERIRADLKSSGIEERHDVVSVDAGDVLARFDRHDLEVSSMGRPAGTDPALHACAAAAGLMAAGMVTGAAADG